MAVVIVIILLCLACLVYLISIYNGLVTLRRQTANAWSQIDIQLRRRYGLIPNLVEAVKAYIRHEHDTLTDLISARNKALAAATVSERGTAESEVRSLLGSLFVLAEAYPDLKANQNVLALQEELKSTEDKVAFARQYYNDVVTAYNTRLETFPASMIASSSGFRPKELFLIEELKERDNVKVEF
jgi:LemA protein